MKRFDRLRGRRPVVEDEEERVPIPEKYTKGYDTLREMPVEVLANRIVTALQSRPKIEWVGILCNAIEQMRQDWREEGDIEDQFCRDCEVTTTHRVEKIEGIGQPKDFILRCSVCGKVRL
jgi:hypothetical protein